MRPAPDHLHRLFSLAGAMVLPAWLLLIYAPSARWSQRLATLVVPLLLDVVYVTFLDGADAPAGAGFNSLAQVAKLFSVPQALLAGWVHYLAFHLFTGAWQARDAVRLGISRGLVASTTSSATPKPMQ